MSDIATHADLINAIGIWGVSLYLANHLRSKLVSMSATASRDAAKTAQNPAAA